jgi:hypothetical protein
MPPAAPQDRPVSIGGMGPKTLFRRPATGESAATGRKSGSIRIAAARGDLPWTPCRYNVETKIVPIPTKFISAAIVFAAPKAGVLRSESGSMASSPARRSARTNSATTATAATRAPTVTAPKPALPPWITPKTAAARAAAAVRAPRLSRRRGLADWTPVVVPVLVRVRCPRMGAAGLHGYGTTFPGNHRSHCTISPDTYVVRSVGQVGRNNGRN